MRAIEKARHQQGNAAQQVPRDTEPRNAARRQVREFVDEHDRPIQAEHCNHGTEKLERVVQRQHRTSRKPGVEAGYRGEEVDPVESGSRNQQVVKRSPQLSDGQLALDGFGLIRETQPAPPELSEIQIPSPSGVAESKSPHSLLRRAGHKLLLGISVFRYGPTSNNIGRPPFGGGPISRLAASSLRC